MKIRVFRIAGLCAAMSTLLVTAGCAPTTRSTEGSSETFANTSEASTKFTSSTSPRSSSDQAELQRLHAFTAVNFSRLREEMARGNGEHLAALASLLHISEAHQAEFFALSKQNFSRLFSSEQTTPDEMLARLDTQLSIFPYLQQ